jgi:RHS repeat-associated protein
VCPTWTSLPAHLKITNGSGDVLLRERDGAPALCDNSSVTDLKEWFGPGPGDYARTRLSYDAWGSYDTVWYPDPAGDQDNDPDDLHDKPIKTEKQRLRVDYVYDNNGHANIGSTTDSHGLNSTATFDGRTGRIAKRTDANGQVTTYSYDAFGRLATITGPYQQGTGTPTVRFEYRTLASGYACAIARHFDVRHPGDTIDTVAFVDGIGRRTQTKQDGTIFNNAGAVPTNVMLVSPAVEYDALGRIVKTRYPISEPLGNITAFNPGGGLATTMEWDLLDRQTARVTPYTSGGNATSTKYEFASVPPAPKIPGVAAKLFRTTVTDPLGKTQVTWTDVRNNVIAVDDGQPAIRTGYGYDPMGQLIGVTDNAGNVTTHTYDLMGRRTTTQTPDGGLVETRWDGAGNMVAKITPNLRKSGQQINYRYDIDRLVAVDYPDATPDVAYTYGGAGAPGNTAGRVTTIEDGARTQRLTYDRLGEVETEVARTLLHNGPSEPFTTSFTHDAFGRLLTMTYPDGEVLTHQYDSGGLLSSLQGRKPMPTGTVVTDYLRRLEYDEFQSKRYQEFGNGVRTEYTIDSATRWLARQMTDAPARRVQDLNFRYDRVGNVLEMDNRLPSPQTELKGGPSRQEYTYDPYYRLQSAKGSAPQAPNRQRDYTHALTYDLAGNIQSKVQLDTTSQVTSSGAVRNPKQEDATSYRFDPMTYNSSRPHQLASTGVASYSYDDNGNLTRILNAKGQVTRIITRDAADRAVRIDDASNSTDYRYDHLGLLGVQRDSLGETAFVNNWYQTTNQGWTWRQIWAGDDRIAQATEKLDYLGNVTRFHYYQHEDLQGSTNLVTDVQGLVFEHIEYFPSGELWIQENSTTHRTPYRFVGALNDEARNLNSLGQRWYEPREQLFYSPEPLLYDEPESVIGDPGLLPAYSYAESNPLRLFDKDGLAGEDVHGRLSKAFRGDSPVAFSRSSAKAALAVKESKRHSRLWQSLVRHAVSERADKRQEWTDKLSAKPLVEFELTSMGGRPTLQKVSLGFFTAQGAVWERSATAPQSAAGSSGATGQQGGWQSARPSAAAMKAKKSGAAATGTSHPVRPKSGN